MKTPVYLDYAASWPVHPAVAEAMADCLRPEGPHANPSSSHAEGQRAARVIERARESVAALVGADAHAIVLTSGATESDNLAILGAARAGRERGRHLVTSRVEHRAVVDAFRQLEREGFEGSWLRPSTDGQVAPEQVEEALRPDTLLVSVMHGNNETGTLNDVAAIGAVCRGRGVLYHVDAAQGVGKVPVDVEAWNADLVAFTAHKLGGPKGIGALYVRQQPRPALQPLPAQPYEYAEWKKARANIDYQVADVNEWQFPAEGFDCVASIAAFHHLPLAQTLARIRQRHHARRAVEQARIQMRLQLRQRLARCLRTDAQVQRSLAQAAQLGRLDEGADGTKLVDGHRGSPYS